MNIPKMQFDLQKPIRKKIREARAKNITRSRVESALSMRFNDLHGYFSEGRENDSLPWNYSIHCEVWEELEKEVSKTLLFIETFTPKKERSNKYQAVLMGLLNLDYRELVKEKMKVEAL